MKRSFYTVLAAQFFSSLADNALILACIALLREILNNPNPGSQEPLLKFFFTVAYVVLAPFVGAFADSRPKGSVMFITNLIKVFGCAIMLVGVSPMMAMVIVGLGAAAYSPAKYGIVTEIVPANKLVAANGWIEALTVLSIIFGTVLGGFLSSTGLHEWVIARYPTWTLSPALTAITFICGVYGVAAILNKMIPDTGKRYRDQHIHPVLLVKDFVQSSKILWTDKLGQITLAITTLLWGVAAVMQFIVLDWAQIDLGKNLKEASYMQAFVGVGSTIGAVLAARFISMRKATRVIPIGMFVGISLITMLWIRSVWLAFPLMIGIGALAGFFLVPMNAMLQHRGYTLLSAGHSIAVQNFNENLSILIMLGVYYSLKNAGMSLHQSIVIFIVLITVLMALFYIWYLYNRKYHNADALIAEIPEHH
ncbi:MAG: lysophospholipid transporter LplT [Burkholderiales bacterium]|nr:lysophospholipid transporter LplT [Burkholderiales bacterium]MCE1176715.1 lysophospholipid transporter LplT [Burkholderiales bacterium]